MKELKKYWYDETKANLDGASILAFVTNKIDLYESQKVSHNDGKALAEKIDAIFQTASVLSDSGISKLFENIGKTYLVPGFDYQSGDKKVKKNKTH